MLLDKSATYHPKGGWNMMELGSVYCWIHMTWISVNQCFPKGSTTSSGILNSGVEHAAYFPLLAQFHMDLVQRCTSRWLMVP